VSSPTIVPSAAPWQGRKRREGGRRVREGEEWGRELAKAWREKREMTQRYVFLSYPPHWHCRQLLPRPQV